MIELLSPTNKLPGRGRQEYEERRRDVLGTRTNLVEIDLIRADAEPEVDLQQIIHTLYDTFRFRQQIDYGAEPVPPLRPEDAAWADELLWEAELR